MRCINNAKKFKTENFKRSGKNGNVCAEKSGPSVCIQFAGDSEFLEIMNQLASESEFLEIMKQVPW